MSLHKICCHFLCATLLGLAFALTLIAQETKPLTNQDVIRLFKLGLSGEIIITKIAESPSNFDLSIEGLAMLAQNKVPNEVIKAMQAKSSNAPRTRASVTDDKNPGAIKAAPTAPAKTSSVPLPPDKGVYLWDGKAMHLLTQSRVPSMGQSFWRSVTPFVKKKIELQMIGAHAKAQFDHNQPTIVVSGMGDVVPGVPSFRLLYVKTGGMRKDRRIVGTYDVGGFFGSVSMVDNEIECKIQKLADGIYAFMPARPLTDGEYGVAHVPQLSAASTQPSFAPPIWDFGVYAEGRPSIAVIVLAPLQLDILDPACYAPLNCPGTFLESGARGVWVTTDGPRLASASVFRDGAVSDGVTLLLLRVLSDTPVSFTLKKPGGTTASANWGLLRALDGSAAGSTVTATPKAINAQQKMAFAVYQSTFLARRIAISLT